MCSLSASFASDAGDMSVSDGDNMNFTQLQDDIDSAGSVVDLSNDYECEDGFKQTGVNISNDITVNGNGVTIDGADKSTIFNVSSREASFNDIEFVNSSNAVVASDCSNLVFEGCRFINAGVSFNGANLTFKNCEFMQNSFIRANGENVYVLESQFHDMRILDSAILINSSNVVFDANEFESNIAYNLSGDTLYTGGFASLVNITSGEAEFSNNRFRNNTVGYLIYSSNSTDVSITGLTVEDCDFSAYTITGNVRKDVSGNGTIVAGNFTNLEITESSFTNIAASRDAYLFDVDCLGNFSLTDSQFANINCPFGLVYATGYGYARVPQITEGTYLPAGVTFDNLAFENITVHYNMTCCDYVNGEYIWDYCSAGQGHGLWVLNPYADASLTNLYFDNVEAGCEYIYVHSKNVDLDNFTMASSRTVNPYLTNDYDGEIILYIDAIGNVSFENISLDNITSLTFNHTSYNSTLSEYLPCEYISGSGGLGMYIDARGNVDVRNLEARNSIVSGCGVLSVYAWGNLSFENATVENLCEDFSVSLDGYYDDAGVTFRYETDKYSTFIFDLSGDNVEVSDISVDNVSCSGDDLIVIDGYNGCSVENITLINSFLASWSQSIAVYGANVSCRNVLIDNVTGSTISNVTSYNPQLGKYVWNYECNYYDIGLGVESDYFAFVENVTVSNILVGGTYDQIYVSGTDVAANNLVLDNITRAVEISIKWDKDYGYLNESSHIVGYETGVGFSARESVNLTNLSISNLEACMAEFCYFTSPNINIDNLTIENITVGGYGGTSFDKDIGEYVTKYWMSNSDCFLISYADNAVIRNVRFTNMKNVGSEGLAFSINAKHIDIENMTVSNVSGGYDCLGFDYDKMMGYCEQSNAGECFGIYCEDLRISNSTFSNLKSAAEYDNSGILNCWGNMVLDNCSFSNCSAEHLNRTRQYDNGSYEEMDHENHNYGIISHSQNAIVSGCEFIDCRSEFGGIFYLDCNLNSTVISNSRFINNSADYGGCIYIHPDIWLTAYLLISDSNFTENRAIDGGVLYIEGIDPSGYLFSDTDWLYDIEISNSTFENNSAGRNGGALYMAQLTTNNTVSGCNFTQNTAGFNGGAIYVLENTRNLRAIDSSIFVANHADYNGGAFYFNDTVNRELFVDYRWFNRTVMFSDDADFEGYNIRIINCAYENNTDYELKVIKDANRPSQNQTLSVEIAPDATGSVEVSVISAKGEIILNGTYRLTNGTASFDLGKLDMGLYNVSVKYDNYSYDDTNDYLFHIVNMTFSVAPSNLTADVSARNVTVRENATFDISNLSADFRGKVNITVDNATYVREVSSTVEIVKLLEGNKTANVTFWGDIDYEDLTVSVDFTVSKLDLDASVSIGNETTLDNVTADISVDDDFNGNVSITVDNVTVYDGPVNSTIDIGKFSGGNRTANVTFYGDDDYANKSVTVDFTVSKADLDVNVTAGDVISTRNATINITGIPEGYEGNVTITVDNMTVYDGPVNSTIDIGKLSCGNKTANVTFYGDERYNDESVEVTFRVSSTVNAEDLRRGWNSPYDYMATFLDESLNPLANAEVIFTVSGRNYTAKTDSEGVAYLNTSKLAVGKYEVTCINPVTGENATATTTIVKRLVENKDMTMDFVDGTYYRVRAIGDDGNPEVAGKYVMITVNKVTYKCKTDKNGYACLKINLNPKKYVITAVYKKYKVSNKLVVKQTLKLVKKIVKIKKSAKQMVLKATVKTSKGKALAGKKVTFKFYGKFYTAKTNKKGIAQVTVKKSIINKLKAGGKYQYYAKVITNYVYGTVRVAK